MIGCHHGSPYGVLVIGHLTVLVETQTSGAQSQPWFSLRPQIYTHQIEYCCIFSPPPPDQSKSGVPGSGARIHCFCAPRGLFLSTLVMLPPGVSRDGPSHGAPSKSLSMVDSRIQTIKLRLFAKTLYSKLV